MGSEEDGTLISVEKLARKLRDLTSVPNHQQEEAINKILKKLSVLPMTIEILMLTEIGKQVNCLRKMGGKVSTRAKALVKKWKQLLPEAEDTQHSQGQRSVVTEGHSLAMRGLEHRGGVKLPVVHVEAGEDRVLAVDSPSRKKHQHRLPEVERVAMDSVAQSSHKTHRPPEVERVAIDSLAQSSHKTHRPPEVERVAMDSLAQSSHKTHRPPEVDSPSQPSRKKHRGPPEEVGRVAMDLPTQTSHKKQHKDKEKKRKHKSSSLYREEESFSQALDVPAVKMSTARQTQRTKGERLVDSSSGAELDDVLIIGATPAHTLESPRTAVRERSPATPSKGGTRGPAQRDPTIGVKRAAPQEVVIGQSKRSRTQVYSGKRVSGPQAVTSLFDMCMKILIDNIDMIEDVGPSVPYHVLEPLLQRCTAAQLMKLEEFNPHLVEDTDELWKKHVIKDFKICKLPCGGLWRDLYQEKLAEREEKLRNLTARIKANSHAREEPQRKAKVLSTVGRKPGRRSGVKRSGFPTMERPHPGTELMKRTMKMAKERNHMVSFKGGRRK